MIIFYIILYILHKNTLKYIQLKWKIIESVGCFADPPSRLTLKKSPEHPDVIQTRFLLYTRSKREFPKNLRYDDDSKSILQSQFDSVKSLKVVIHGYKGSGSDIGAILMVQALLDLVINIKRVCYRSNFVHRGFCTRWKCCDVCIDSWNFSISALLSVYHFSPVCRVIITTILKYPIIHTYYNTSVLVR